MSSHLRFAVLGPVRAWQGDRELPLGPPQQRAVLAVLLLRENTQVPVAELIDALWTDDVPASADHVIRSYVYRLRKALGPSAIASVGHGYLLPTGPASLDLAEFRDAVTAAREAGSAGDHAKAVVLLDQALGLWGGSALAGVPGPFAEAQRPHLERLRLGALEAKATALVQAGAYGEAETLLGRLSSDNPLDERFRELRMLALYRQGRQSEALSVYRETQELLADELGVDPGHGLRTLHERILRADPTLLPAAHPVAPAPGEPTASEPPPPVLEQTTEAAQAAVGYGGRPLRPMQLPADLPGFTGRTAELARADALVPRGDPSGRSVVLITGMAGVGKTAFAVHWAHSIADRFPDGQIYLNLRGFDPSRPTLTPKEALSALFDSLGVRPEQLPADLDRQSAYLRSLVADKRLLLVLDNVRDTEQVRPLLPGGDNCLVVVTSRNQLRGLSVLDGAGVIALDVLPPSEAVSLLSRRLGELEDLDAALDDAALDEIAERCGRLPLAIALVAARMVTAPRPSLSCALGELRNQQGVLDAFSDVDSVVDVRSVFSWSVRALSEPAMDLFRLLALHRAMGCDDMAAASLAGQPLAQVRRSLGELVAANLVVIAQTGRYMYHDLIRLYAAELATELDPADRREAIHRLLDHYVVSAQDADVTINPHRSPVDTLPVRPGVLVRTFGGHAQAWQWFQLEREALLAALSLATDDGFDEHAWRLVSAMETFMYRTGRWREALEAEQLALAAVERLGAELPLARVHNIIGRSYLRLQQYDEGHAHLTKAVEVFEAAGLPDRAANVYISLASLAAERARSAEAIRLYEKVLELTADPLLRAMAINNLGNEYAVIGDYGQSLTLCLEALRLFTEIGDRHAEANAWDSVGYAHHRLGHQAKAERAFRHAIATFQEFGDTVNEATTLINLGDCLAADGNLTGAEQAWTDALALLTPLDHPAAAKARSRLDAR